MSWVCLCVPLHVKSALPSKEGALLQKTNRKIQGHHSTLLSDVASQPPFVHEHICLSVCVRVRMAGRACVIHCIEPSAAPITARIFCSKHTCRHLSQSVCVCVCVCACVRFSPSWQGSVSV